MFRRVFVTVGTTEFESLTNALCSEEVGAALIKLGCSQLTVQYGNGPAPDFKYLETRGVVVEKYTLKPSIADDIKEADFVMSHAGAGSCIEILSEHRPLLVVVNEDLMANHQTELAEQLGEEGYLLYCTVGTLAETLRTSDFSSLRKYIKGDMKAFIRHLDKFMGFS